MSDVLYSTPPEVNRLQQRALVVGVVGLALLAVGAFVSLDQFFRSYLVGFIFWTGVTLGCLAIVMLQHLTGGAWGMVIRRPLEAATRTLPLLLVLFLPLAVGVSRIYIWASHNVPEGDKELRHALEHKRAYLNLPFFFGRAVFYFAVWLGLAYFLNKWSREQDETGDPGLTGKLQDLSGPGLILYGLTVTFAAVDWVMSLDPTWFSTIFGILLMGGQALSAMAFVITIAVLLARYEPMSHVFTRAHFHDLGKLLLAFVMLWAYFSFSQFLIIWSGNLPEEIPWYLRRFNSGWRVVGLLLVLFHFMLPFVLLLSRDLKRNARLIALTAMVIIVMRFVDVLWLIAPEFHGRQGFSFHWMDLAAPVGLGGIWLWYFAGQLKARPLLPIRDPNLPEVLEHAGGH